MNTVALGRFLSQTSHAFDRVGYQLQRLAAHGFHTRAAHKAGPIQKPLAFTLNPMEFWECEGEPGLVIELQDGVAWITQTGDVSDHIVKRGGRYESRRHGRIVLQAMSRAAIHVQNP